MTCTSTPISPPSSEHRGDSGDSGGSEGGADGPLPNSPPLPISPLNSFGGTCTCAIHGRRMHTVKKESKDFRFRHLSLCSKDQNKQDFHWTVPNTVHTQGHGRKDRRRSFSRTHATRKAGHPAFPRPLAIGRMFACGRSDLGSRSANLCARRLGPHRVGATQQTYPSISVPVNNTGGSRDTRRQTHGILHEIRHKRLSEPYRATDSPTHTRSAQPRSTHHATTPHVTRWI
jgi:hypothetical protein